MQTLGAPGISAREREVLTAVGEHLTNAEIARRLHLSVRTVETHVSSLLRKLGAENRRELAALALELATAPQAAGQMLGLPSAWTSFVGRERELDAVAEAIASHRLVTLVGPGGIGKTRLATVAAERAGAWCSGGGAFVDLVPVGPDFVVQAVAAALGVVERPLEPLDTAVHDRLGVGRVLLVLDNCEHVLEPVATFVETALARSGDLVVMATSRERLGLSGERVLPVPPLALRDGGGSGAMAEADRLFLDRAAMAGAPEADPGTVAEICSRLEGMPLAIELAAARTASLGVDGLASGLSDHLRLLSSSSRPAGRHRSLRAVIDWSHDLLDETDRALFRRLSAFAAAFDVAGAADVTCNGDENAARDGIARLTDKSLLVHRATPTGSRWNMLETIHAYGREQLEQSGDGPAIHRRLLAWAASEAARLEASLSDDDGWQPSFDAVADNLRAAVAMDTAQLGTGELDTEELAGDDSVVRERFALARALGHLCYARRFLLEAHDHYATAAECAPDPVSAGLALQEGASAALAQFQGDRAFAMLATASDRFAAGGDVARATIALADAASVAGRAPATFQRRLSQDEVNAVVGRVQRMAPPNDPEVDAHMAMAVTWASGPAGTPDSALAERTLHLARQIDSPPLISEALDALGSAATVQLHHKAAAQIVAERVALLDRLPRHDPRSGGELADIYFTSMETAVSAGNIDDALMYARRAYEDQVNRQGLSHFSASHLIVPLLLKGEFAEVLVHAPVMRDGWEKTGRSPAGWMAPSFLAVALVHGVQENEVGYQEWTELADAVLRHTILNAFQRYAGTRLALHRGDLDAAAGHCHDIDHLRPGRHASYVHAMNAERAVLAGDTDAEAIVIRTTEAVHENDFAAAILARARGRLYDDRAELEAAVDQWEALGARFERACTLVLLPDRAGEGNAELDALGCRPRAL